MKKEKSEALRNLGHTMQEDRKKFVQYTIKSLWLMNRDLLVKDLMTNQTKLYEFAYHMYQCIDAENEIEKLTLLTQNLVILEANQNLIDLVQILKTSTKEDLDTTLPYMRKELGLEKSLAVEELYDYLQEQNNQDVKISIKNYQKVLEMKGETNE